MAATKPKATTATKAAPKASGVSAAKFAALEDIVLKLANGQVSAAFDAAQAYGK